VKDMSTDGATGKPTSIELRGEGFEWGIRIPGPTGQAFLRGGRAGDAHSPAPRDDRDPRARRGRRPAQSLGRSRPRHGSDVPGRRRLRSLQESLVAGPGPDALFRRRRGCNSSPSAGQKPTSVSRRARGSDEGLWWFLLSAVGWGSSRC
jgi:hypothetical protein